MSVRSFICCALLLALCPSFAFAASKTPAPQSTAFFQVSPTQQIQTQENTSYAVPQIDPNAPTPVLLTPDQRDLLVTILNMNCTPGQAIAKSSDNPITFKCVSVANFGGAYIISQQEGPMGGHKTCEQQNPITKDCTCPAQTGPIEISRQAINALAHNGIGLERIGFLCF